MKVIIILMCLSIVSCAIIRHSRHSRPTTTTKFEIQDIIDEYFNFWGLLFDVEKDPYFIGSDPILEYSINDTVSKCKINETDLLMAVKMVQHSYKITNCTITDIEFKPNITFNKIDLLNHYNKIFNVIEVKEFKKICIDIPSYMYIFIIVSSIVAVVILGIVIGSICLYRSKYVINKKPFNQVVKY